MREVDPSCRCLAILLTAVALGPGIAAAAVAAESLAGSRPHVVLVMTDDQGYAPIGRHGHPWIRTPHLDALYDRSTRFDRFLVSPTCSPTRAALLTGRYPEQNGVTHTHSERERLSPDSVTLAEVLAAAGYRCGIFGKWHLGDEDEYQPGARGFEESFIHGAGGIGQAYDNSCADAPGNRYFDPLIRHNGRFVQTEGFCTDVFVSAAIGWMNQHHDGDQPLFVYIPTNAPHSPYHAPQDFKQRFLDVGFSEDQAGFYGMIENIDGNMGRPLMVNEGVPMSPHRPYHVAYEAQLRDGGIPAWDAPELPAGIAPAPVPPTNTH